jgi:hypothetical protein
MHSNFALKFAALRCDGGRFGETFERIPGNLSNPIVPMDKLQRLMTLTDRLLTHIEHQIPPEVEMTQEIRILVDEMRNESKNAAACKPALGDEKAHEEKAS